MISRRKFLFQNSMVRVTFLMLICGTMTAGAVSAQAYPDKPIRLVVGSAPGGGTDFAARVTNARFSELLGKQVVIDNRGGAGGLVASDLVAHATADGFTLLQMASNLVILPSLHRELPFDVGRDLAPIVNIVSMPLILVVNSSISATTVSQLIDLARTNKGGLNFSGAGVGSLGHLAAELFKSVTKAPMEHVAYKGGGPAISALIGNEVHFYFSTLPAALVQTRAGRLRALGVTSSKRSAAAPQVPTIAEQGFPGFEVVGWVGMFAPAATPASAINLLNGNMNKVLKLPEIKERLLTDGMEPAGGTPKDFATQVGQDLRKWNAVVKQAGVKPE